MKLHKEFIATVLDEMRSFLLLNYPSLCEVSKPLADEVRQIADRVKKTRDATQLRNYLLEYIGLTSSFWRAIAPYTLSNKLRFHLEKVVSSADFSPQAIQVAQISGVHEYYLERQKELIEPMHIEIQSLQGLCQTLQSTVTALREENQRLRIENVFFMKELVTIQSQTTKKATLIMRDPLPPFIKEPPTEYSAYSVAPVTYEENPASIFAGPPTYSFG
jgi:hypothetical protein